MSTVFLLGGCFPQWDMHGHNPQQYYAANPVKNKVEMRHIVHTLPLTKDQDAAAAGMQDTLKDVSVASVESVHIRLHPSRIKDTAQKKSLSKLLTGMGYPKSAILFEPSNDIKSSEAQIDVTYAAVISPRCPDWRASPVTTYSNTPHSNFGCATTTNLGLQVADPRDLVKGRGDSTPDPERSLRVIRKYRAGEDSGGSDSGGSSSGADATDTGFVPPPPQ